MFRKIAFFLIAVSGCGAALWLAGWLVRPSLGPHPLHYSQKQIDDAVAARDAKFDPASMTSVIKDEKVRPVGQSPIFEKLVRDGQLPPLEQRMPRDPVVMAGCEGVGTYGGTWMMLSPSLGDVGTGLGRVTAPFLARWSTFGYPIKPWIAKSLTPSPDRRQWTVELRPGLKWSDGEPYTADDILFWWEHEANDKDIYSLPPNWMSIGGSFGRIEKIDEFHVRFSFDHPYPLFLEQMAMVGELTATPAHYLRQFHPTLGDATLVARLQSQYGLPSARSVYDFIKALENADFPRLTPWIYRKYSSASPQVFVRNPYFFAVDRAGNQLPYIDRLQYQVVDPQVLPINAANGNVSMQLRSIRYSDFTELMSRRATAGTRVLQWYSGTRSQYVINPNLNRVVDPKDPSTVWKAKLLGDKRFRQALSLAIDRRSIIRADYNNQCQPSQVEPGPQSPFHSEKLANAYVNFDPRQANEKLDELRLAHRDEDGFRTFPDGTRMSFFFDFSPYTGIGPAQFIADDWASVGVRVVVRERSRTLFYLEKDGGLFDFNVWTSESDFLPLLSPRTMVAYTTESLYASGWALWFSRGGMYGDPAALQKGCIPVPPESPMYAAMQDYLAATQAPDIETQKKLIAQICDIAAENVWTIGIATSPPDLVVAKNDLHNVPTVALTGYFFAAPANTGVETYYFAHPQDSPGAIEQTRDSIVHPTYRPATGDIDAGASSLASRIFHVAPILLALAGLGWLGFRYPFVGRRLAIMVPTLTVISLMVFTIIQLPPGDFLTTKITQLNESGDPQVERLIDELRTQFHFEDPGWKKYLRWVGVPWFASFDAKDAGLMQGNLGRSMASGTLVNSMIGDRLFFTVLLSFVTILFTWSMALPIGIYSAVRQYSLSDYTLTLIGFIGMCVPPFLLAIVLMALSGVSGLFSPEFSAQPEWSWPKVLDLMKHLWIPIVVLGAGGTAGMIRVMRANLLDELRRPYVTTAIAKGVRPFRLLMKYPVRMSLNPFISGIGGLFPALISGGAIVSIVLTLQTIGPLMLSALRDQDMYLAGSLLMLLNALSVVGTLFSDLLLLWLDPRIRVTGGTR